MMTMLAFEFFSTLGVLVMLAALGFGVFEIIVHYKYLSGLARSIGWMKPLPPDPTPPASPDQKI